MRQRIAPIFILMAGVLWGSMGIFVRHFNSLGLGAMDIGWLRVLVGLITVGGYLAIFNREQLKIRFRDIWCFVGTGVGSLFMLNWTYYTAMQYTSLSVAGVLLYTAPIFVTLMSVILFKEKLTLKKLIGLALAFLGCVFISGLGSSEITETAGILWGLGAGFSYALYSIFGRYAIQRGYGAWTITFYSFLFSFLANCFTCTWQSMEIVFSQTNEIVWILALGVGTAFLPYLFYGKGLESMEGSRASILASIEPVVATLISVFVFTEPLYPSGAIGIILVLIAIGILSLKNRGENNEG